MRARSVRVLALAVGAGVVALAAGPCLAAGDQSAKVPITTTSAEARKAYLDGRDAVEKLRATDGYAAFTRAVTLDPKFALGYYGQATSAPTAGDFFAALRKAAALADGASPGEAHMIRALEAGTNGRPKQALDHLRALVSSFPDDERVHNLLGGFYFGRQEWQRAIAEYERATAINPAFSQPYNQLGYALRFLERYGEAEKAFQKYIELIPNEPNPHDSYAELLMKTGRFDDSIAQYRKALAIDANFVPSYVGIANDEVFAGRPEQAHQTLAKLESIARNDGERRVAHFWGAVAYLHQGDGKSAVGEVEREYEIASKLNDRVAMSGDLNFIATILLESGSPDAALAKYDEGLKTIDLADASAEVKEAAHRNNLANRARVALARKDVAGAATLAQQYAMQVEIHKVPFERWQSHEIAGLVALAKGDNAGAVRELQQANQQDPRAQFELGEAYAADGNAAAGRAAFERAASFNGLAVNFAYVRAKAKAKLGA